MPRDLLLIRRPNGDLLSFDPTRGAEGFRLLLTLDAATTLVGSGDLDGNGRADLLLSRAGPEGRSYLVWDTAGGPDAFRPLQGGPAGTVPALGSEVVVVLGDVMGGPGDEIGLVGQDLTVRDLSGAAPDIRFDLGQPGPTGGPPVRFLDVGDIAGSPREELVFLGAERPDGSVPVYRWGAEGFADLPQAGAATRVLAGGNFFGDTHDELIYAVRSDTPFLGPMLYALEPGTGAVRPLFRLGTGPADQIWEYRGSGDLDGDGFDEILLQMEIGDDMLTIAYDVADNVWTDLTAALRGNDFAGFLGIA
ncbi:MAG TPA: hypothetical protein VED40_23520 [Azospirillaceae bacterium]|nr:hypothetical protein [Azospirillaceae bacterium]